MRRPRRILAVDDQPANLMLLKKVLEPAGFEVSQARSGAEALALAQETGPDLILLDMHLPDMHGLDVLRRLRETPWGLELRAVAMSALASPEDRDLWLKAGCVGSIEKPIEVRTFVRDVSRWLPGRGPAAPEEQEVDQRRPDKLGELLVANLLISPEQLSQAVAVQPKSGKRLGQILVEQGSLSEDDIAWALSNQLGYPYVFLRPEIVDSEAVRLLPEKFLRERRVLPILKFGQEMTLAMVDPTDQRTIEEVVARTGLQVKRALALSSNIEEMQTRIFPRGGSAPGREFVPIPTVAEAQYFQFHLVQALQQGGSEIHFDPAGDGQARVRYRLQGVLVDRPGQSADLHAAILRHLRELTGAGDGPAGTATTTLTVNEKEILAVATFLPTISGQAATVALYPLHADSPDLGILGQSDEVVRPLRDALGTSSGVVMVGCTDRWARAALLHALIPHDLPGKIWALETVPVYRRPTINQTLIGPEADLVPHIRAAVRAGTDLIVVDDAASSHAIVAALEAGRERVILAGYAQSDIIGMLTEAVQVAGSARVASSLRGLLAARTIRLLCPSCKQPAPDTRDSFGGSRTFVPSGCEACGFTGFKGRRLLVDVWTVDPESRGLLRSGRAWAVFERVQQTRSGMIDQGLALVIDGLTSLEELSRVVEGAPWTSPTSSS